MPCSKETLFWVFYNVSSSSLLLLLFLYFSSTLLLKLLNFIGSYPIIQRNQNEYEYNFFSDEEEDVDTETYYYTESREKDHLVADVIHGGESLVFLSNRSVTQRTQNHVQEFVNSRQSLEDEDDDNDDDEDDSDSDEQFSILASAGSEAKHNDSDPMVEEAEDMTARDADSVQDSGPEHGGPTSPFTTYRQKNSLVDSDENYGEDYINQGIQNKKKMDQNLHGDEKAFIFAATQMESKKLQVREKDDEEIFGDSCTVGSTSKSSSEWRSSIKDSGTEDPFSSSSRRSCPKWESYTVFQKYDEEMMFLDRVSAQKLHETESLKSIQVNPRSISDRIVHKIATMNKKKSSDFRQNPYHELEAAYVAQICLTWEALNWNYKNFNSKRASKKDFDPGCPGHIAQQFQQFQVLLQRYVENEPYEQGRRPEVYARMRLLAPKLLLVPEYREDDPNEDGFGSRISSAAFLMIMEDGIRSFMDFLKLDKQKPGQILTSFFKRNRRGTVDPALLQLMKKVNKKKKMKLKDLRRARKCIRKKKLKVEEEMEILMGLIDLKVVSRVLRMSDISEEQLHWCEEKMSKVRVLDGKLQRDSLPLFFPAH
ncbi:uncharacterized protein LOC110619602 isoform X3 [Manihot esculenta]|uniref:Uncharacterized protein n=1 Tax=Manihot esculenta TaxID=3983 RepID=A0ACB7IBF5_MANES|nr:uncharacterized protein LOC110619602 isoform X3 [Manihot esculenta]KAG8661539.1 hypothetical protein MANES_01G011300v8 [Manihot esculenta]